MFRSTKSSISINSCTELSKTQFFSVSIVKLTSIHFVFKKRFTDLEERRKERFGMDLCDSEVEQPNKYVYLLKLHSEEHIMILFLSQNMVA